VHSTSTRHIWSQFVKCHCASIYEVTEGEDAIIFIVVNHVFGSGAELLVALDHFLHGSQEIQLGHSFAPRSKTKHASFGTDRSQVGSRGVRTQTRNQLKPNIPINPNSLAMDIEDLLPPL
jgi:hypothetical protein